MVDSRQVLPNSEPTTLRIDVKAVYAGNATDQEKEILTKLLLDNAQKVRGKDEKVKPVTNFQCYRDCYVLDAFPDMTNPANDKFKNSYIFLRTETTKGLEAELYFIDNLGVSTALPISNAQKDLLTKHKGDIFREIPANVSLFAKDEKGQFIINNDNPERAERRLLADTIRSVPNHAFTQSGQEYPVEYQGKQYKVQLTDNILLRESKKKNEKKIRYEGYAAQSFYSVAGKAALYNSFGTMRPDGKKVNFKKKNATAVTVEGQKAAYRSRDVRIVKVEPAERAEFAARVQKFSQVIKFLHLGHKKPVATSIQGNPFAVGVMKKVPGESIDNLVKKDPEYVKNNGLQIVTAALKAYKEEMADKNIVHCDIKPGNIMIQAASTEQRKGLVAVTIDLEDAKLKSSKEASPGTPGYLAPEILSKSVAEANMTRQSDIYALGLVCMGVLIGKEVTRYGDEVDKALTEIRDRYGDKTHDFLKSMIDANPAKRPTVEAGIKMFEEVQRLQAIKASTNRVAEMPTQSKGLNTTITADAPTSVPSSLSRSKSFGSGISKLLTKSDKKTAAEFPDKPFKQEEKKKEIKEEKMETAEQEKSNSTLKRTTTSTTGFMKMFRPVEENPKSTKALFTTSPATASTKSTTKKDTAEAIAESKAKASTIAKVENTTEKVKKTKSPLRPSFGK